MSNEHDNCKTTPGGVPMGSVRPSGMPDSAPLDGPSCVWVPIITDSTPTSVDEAEQVMNAAVDKVKAALEGTGCRMAIEDEDVEPAFHSLTITYRLQRAGQLARSIISAGMGKPHGGVEL